MIVHIHGIKFFSIENLPLCRMWIYLLVWKKEKFRLILIYLDCLMKNIILSWFTFFRFMHNPLFGNQLISPTMFSKLCSITSLIFQLIGRHFCREKIFSPQDICDAMMSFDTSDNSRKQAKRLGNRQRKSRFADEVVLAQNAQRMSRFTKPAATWSEHPVDDGNRKNIGEMNSRAWAANSIKSWTWSGLKRKSLATAFIETLQQNFGQLLSFRSRQRNHLLKKCENVMRSTMKTPKTLLKSGHSR